MSEKKWEEINFLDYLPTDDIIMDAAIASGFVYEDEDEK